MLTTVNTRKSTTKVEKLLAKFSENSIYLDSVRDVNNSYRHFAKEFATNFLSAFGNVAHPERLNENLRAEFERKLGWGDFPTLYSDALASEVAIKFILPRCAFYIVPRVDGSAFSEIIYDRRDENDGIEPLELDSEMQSDFLDNLIMFIDRVISLYGENFNSFGDYYYNQNTFDFIF